MSEINDQLSDTSSDLNWPLDHIYEGQQHDRVIFENVADQYVKGEDVTAFFTILQDIKTNPDADQIGLLRVGCTNIKDCLAYAPIQFGPSITSGSLRHGTATFPSSLLPVTDEEFYQFCYIYDNKKNLGSSIPFQLNCTLNDIDLLSNTNNGLIPLSDRDVDGMIVIQTKQMLVEEKLRQDNQQLLQMNRRLESQRDECQTRLELMEITLKEQTTKLNNDMQALLTVKKTAVDELTSRQQSEIKLRTEYDACRAACAKYQSDALEHAERCRKLEDAQTQSLTDTNQIRSQLAVTTQLAKEQATQVIELERRMMQFNELTKNSDQRQTLLEQKLRDLRVTSEKSQLTMQTQVEEYSRQNIQSQERINELETINNLLEEELNTVKNENENLLITAQQDKDLVEQLKHQLEEVTDLYRQENESANNQIEKLQQELNEKDVDQHAYQALKSSYTLIEKRCVKHQKTELEVKRQLAGYQSFINDLQREIQDLTNRLSDGAEEYKTLSRKYQLLQQSTKNNEEKEPVNQINELVFNEEQEPIDRFNEPVFNEEELVEGLQNTYPQPEQQQEEQELSSARSSLANLDDEVKKCPMCFWEFPVHMNVDGKREHIEHHFQ